MERQAWGTAYGRQVELFTLDLGAGSKAVLTNFGAALVSLFAPDSRGKVEDVVLGYDSVQGYVNCTKYFGVVVGRYANRIGGAQFTLDGQVYELAANDGRNHLHGGPGGFAKRLWEAEEIAGETGPALKLSYFSPHLEEGYPGNLQVEVVYSSTGTGGLRLDYYASCDRNTIVNLTNHAYFNLCGQGKGLILDHELELCADFFTPTDAESIPTGEILKVEGTPLDFRTKTPIGARIEADHEQLRFGKGYDHNWVIRRQGPGLVKAARVEDPVSGRVLEVLTTKPGIQFYSGNYLDGVKGKGGAVYERRSGFCLETQFFPDSPHFAHFTCPVLKAGERYHYTTVFQFSSK
ncbi:MAG TPA: galactose mutarotase [Firmicutes bacterium]|nr:galactose mutarotase [Bacillota bacterium]